VLPFLAKQPPAGSDRIRIMARRDEGGVSQLFFSTTISWGLIAANVAKLPELLRK
jgi:hypothetical protein